MGLNKKKVIKSQSLDDWAYLLWVDKAEKVHPREKPLLLLLPAFDKSLVALDGEEAPLVEVGGGPPPWVESVQDFLCKLVMKPHMHLEVWFYMNGPSKLAAPISSKQYFGLQLCF